MKRLRFDVSRWSIYLHRQARGLEQVDRSDSPQLQFADELFDRLYAGDSEPVSTDAKTDLAAWSERLHTLADQSPSFARLQRECMGDEYASATATETLLQELAPHLSQSPDNVNEATLRKALQNGCEKSSSAISDEKESAEAVSQVAFGKLPGKGTQKGEVQTHTSPRTIAARLKNDERLRRIALLAGKFKRIAAQKQRAKVKHGADEVTDVEQGAEVARLLPAELVRLFHPRQRLAFLRDFMEKRCLQYRLEGSESLGKGPLVVCLDKSGSMHGTADIWATAVALALLDVAQRQRRPFALLGFDAVVKHEAFVGVGEPLPEAALFVSCAGGTNIGRVLNHGLEIIRKHPGKMKKADLVLITDGASETDGAPFIRKLAAELGVTTLGFGIGVDKSDLEPWCDEAHAIQQLDALDDKTAEKLFGM